MSDKFISYKFVDSDGVLRDKVVRTGKGLEETWFDGSSFGFCDTDKSDLLLVPDEASEFFDPVRNMQSVFCFLRTPDGEEIDADYRTLAARARDVDDQTKGALFGVEPEFFLLNEEGYPLGVANQRQLAEVKQGPWYGALPPIDSFAHIRDEMVEALEKAGFDIEGAHHEVAPGQAEMSWRCSNILTTCDRMVLFKYMVAAVAARHGCKASFAAKPFENLNGNGCHTHQSLPAMRDAGNGEEVLMAYAQGLIEHYDELVAVCCVGETSQKRLVPGFEAPTKENNGVGWHNRTKTVRIPGRGGRLEYRLPDPDMNPYVALTKMLEFGRGAVKDKIGV